MASLNLVQIIGRLGRDPELRYTSSGSPICSLNVATDESYNDRDGNRVERVEWHRVSVFGKIAESCANHSGQGQPGLRGRQSDDPKVAGSEWAGQVNHRDQGQERPIPRQAKR